MVWCNILRIVFKIHKHASQFRSESCQVRTQKKIFCTALKKIVNLNVCQGKSIYVCGRHFCQKQMKVLTKGYISSVRCFLGIKPMTLAVLVPGTSNWTTGMQIKVCQIWTAISTKLNYWPEQLLTQTSYYVFCACTQGPPLYTSFWSNMEMVTQRTIFDK